MLVLSVVYEDFSLRILLKITKRHFGGLHRLILIRFHDAIDGTIIVFIRNTNRLYKILNYIHLNEKVRHIILVHCGDLDNDDERDLHDELKTSLPVLEKAGVFPHLNIEFHHEDRTFGPELIESMSRKYRVHKNRIFIGSIHHSHQFDYSDLGGVRIIF